jgi:putative transposase
MANIYTQIHVQFVFAVKFRAAMISKSWKDNLHKYITGIIQANHHKMLQINSVEDHIHFLAGIRPDHAISSLVQNIKSESTKWINAKKLCSTPFSWQTGFGAFSYCKREVHNVIDYIRNQESHHKKESFLAEYSRILNEFEIDYAEAYLFHKPL